jgi:indolepyruvate ferredoxin oxidoreductase alpha subunit
LGVDPDHVILLDPLKKNHDQNVTKLKQELEYKGVSVVIAQRECIQTAARRKRLEKSVNL